MIIECERCKVSKDCQFIGTPAAPEVGVTQNGEWLCAECVPLREAELGEAIARIRNALDAPPTPRQLSVVQAWDQLTAKIRDMDEEERAAFIPSLAEEMGITEEAARQWVDDLMDVGSGDG